ncbi:glycosyltransferase, partial [Gemella sp. 19428wG2_WT2a]
VMESINEGCPSISYDLKYGPSEIIENGVNGYLIEPNNIEKFAEAMVSIKKYPLKEVQTKNSLRYECAIKNLENLLADI